MYAQIHHISILNRLIKPTFDFYHNTLGLKLLMKTINQDDQPRRSHHVSLVFLR